ncbi:hypothetical protein [Frankia sp. Cj3]|uniref:hypothetical protein n=1 Tax=Frankia sp. Cj3 TaxID=2880976 RepID=UPI001EF461CD|nr:hypothetical protein [Frankia sp. Cj3]
MNDQTATLDEIGRLDLEPRLSALSAELAVAEQYVSAIRKLRDGAIREAAQTGAWTHREIADRARVGVGTIRAILR